VTLFEFGRTINCACGERVGLEKQINLSPQKELKFFADVMLHRLVRLLRALGFDTAWEDAIKDDELVRRSLFEHRHLLTLDRRLSNEWTVGNILLLESEETREQLRQVVEKYLISRPKALFTRCMVCNTPLRPARPREISDVPEPIQQIQSKFLYCSNCSKAYWDGSHTDRMRAVFDSIFKELR